MAQSVFGKNLARIRKSLNMTQEQLANKLNVSPQAVSKWEKSNYPDSELLPKLARTLNTSLDVLFGLKSDDNKVDIEQLITDEIHRAKPEERSKIVMRMCYSIIGAFNEFIVNKMTLPESFDLETYAELRTDKEIAIARLNDDLRYFCFLSIPENGVNSYTGASQGMVRLFKMLADENALRIIYYLGSGVRNRMHSKEIISQRLNIPIEIVSRVIDRLDRFGLVWRISAEISDNPPILYGYTYSTPLIMILALAKSLTNYIQFQEPIIDKWNTGPFRMSENKTDNLIPQVSTWDND